MLSWVRGEGADDCLDERELAAAVRRRLGYDPFHEPVGRVLEGVVSRQDDHWSVRLFNRSEAGAAGSRHLESEADDCRSLDNPIVLSFALAIDPSAALSPPPESPTPESPTPESLPPEELPAERARESEEPPSAPAVEPPRGEAGPRDGPLVTLGAVAAHGLVPGWGFGARLGVQGALVSALEWRVAATYWPEQRARLGGADFGIGLTALSIGACAGRRVRWISLQGCLDVEIGVVHAVVFRPIPNSPGDELWGAAYADLRVAIHPPGPIEMALHAGIGVPMRRLRYHIVGRREVVFEPNVVVPIVGIDVGVHFF
jgi:hypothetical protein